MRKDLLSRQHQGLESGERLPDAVLHSGSRERRAWD